MKALDVVAKCNEIGGGSLAYIEWIREIILKSGKVVQKHCSGKFGLGIDYAIVCKTASEPMAHDAEPTLWLLNKYIKVTTKNKLMLMAYTTKDYHTKVDYTDSKGGPILLEDILEDMYAKDKPKTIDEDIHPINLDLNNITLIEKA